MTLDRLKHLMAIYNTIPSLNPAIMNLTASSAPAYASSQSPPSALVVYSDSCPTSNARANHTRPHKRPPPSSHENAQADSSSADSPYDSHKRSTNRYKPSTTAAPTTSASPQARASAPRARLRDRSALILFQTAQCARGNRRRRGRTRRRD
jgi:hypothetical protein